MNFIYITLMISLSIAVIAINADVEPFSTQKRIELNNGDKVTEFRVKRVTHKKHKTKKVEQIPADESLRSDQFSEQIEEELGNTGIGKQSANATNIRRRRGHNKRACIYIDIPGSHPEDEVDIIIPGVLSGSGSTVQKDNGFNGIDEVQSAAQTGSLDMQQLQSNEDRKVTNEAVDYMGDIYWLKLPPSETVGSREVLKKLYQVVNDFHQTGKDVLFVPISKGYLNTNEAKNGFLKTLQIDPIDRERHLNTFEIKLI